MKKRKGIKLFPVILLLFFSFTACGKEENRNHANDVTTANISSDRVEKNSEIVSDSLETTSSVAEASNEITSDTTLLPMISYEILCERRMSDSGEEFAYAEYPKFMITGDENKILTAVLDSINEEWKAQSELFLDMAEERQIEDKEFVDLSYVFRQDTFVNITRCDTDIICILVSRSLEEGGPHPNNYVDAYNINAKTGEFFELSDLMTIDDTLKENIKTQLYENYPELDFDDALVEQEISYALDNDTIDWYFWEDQICIGFMEGSFGFSHAEGTLGVLLPF